METEKENESVPKLTSYQVRLASRSAALSSLFIRERDSICDTRLADIVVSFIT